MAARRRTSNWLTYQTYTDLVAAFRMTPGRFVPAARVARCDPATAKRGWERGWTDREPWAKPIKEIVEAEQRAARVMLQDEHVRKIGATAEQTSKDTVEAMLIRERALAEKAKNLAQLEADGAASTAEEAKMIRAYRTDLQGVAVMANQLLSAMNPLVVRVRAELARDVSLKPAEVISLLQKLTGVLKEGAEAAQKTMEMERLLLGQPQQILEAHHTELPPDPADAVAKLTAAFETLQRLGMSPPSIDVTPQPVQDAAYSEESETSINVEYEDAARPIAPVLPLQLPPLQTESKETTAES